MKKRVYDLLITGKNPKRIAQIIGVSLPYVLKIIKQLEADGLVVCINPKGRPKFYEATKKPYPIDEAKLTKLTNNNNVKLTNISCGNKEEKLKRLKPPVQGGSKTVQIQRAQILFHVIVPPPAGTKWDKQYQLKNGVKVYQYSHPFKNLGTVVFQRYKSEKTDKLLVTLPRMLVSKEQIRDEKAVNDFLIDFAMRAVVWFQKRFKCRLGLPEIATKPDFAVVVEEPELAQALKKYTFKVGEVWADSSPPDNLPEIESKNPVHIINYLESIQKIKDIEENLKQTDDKIKALSQQIEIANNQIQHLANALALMAEKVSTMAESITTFSNAISKIYGIKKDDDRREIV